ncbi:MAG: preprotein translocase subunit YajC [Ignavibacteriae bacterium]|nr:preprotein translocase subunit YajC [Ignavibacteriota bacterium]
MSPQGQQGGAGSLISMLVMFGAVILIMYFLMIRPQQKRQKEHQKMLENLKRGDKVVTTAGIHGTITDIDGSSMILQVSDNVKITFEKTSIAAKK